MKNIRLSINDKLYYAVRDPLVKYIVKYISDPAWGYGSKSIWSNIRNANSSVWIPVSNKIKDGHLLKIK